MTIWEGEIRELDKLYLTFKGHLPDIVKEMEQLIKTDDANVVMLYSRRCLEVIITDLCETELNRPRKTEPLKGIIDKLNSEEKVPAHIITSMHGLNSMATYGAHPKDFDPEQVKPVLNNLAIIIKWYLKHKDFKVVSKTESREEKQEVIVEVQAPAEVKREETKEPRQKKPKPPVNPESIKRRRLLAGGIVVVVIVALLVRTLLAGDKLKDEEKYMNIEAYRTVQIGDQTWMAENLRTTLFNDGTPIPLVKDDKEWEEAKAPAYSWYENNRKKYGDNYGALYNWYAVNTGKLCPVGWHVPAEEEWRRLIFILGDSVTFFEGTPVPARKEWKMITGLKGDSAILGRFGEDWYPSLPPVAAIKLKEASAATWTPVNIRESFFDGSSYTYSFWITDEFGKDTVRVSNYTDFDTIIATNESGFTALPGGVRNIYGPFNDIGYRGSWWSATEDGPGSSDGRNIEMSSNSNGVTEIQQYKQFGMSVRCIKNLIVTDIDNNSYNTVWIGKQLWMAENLKTTRLNDGTPIPEITGDTTLWNHLTKSPSYSWNGEDKTSYYETYGRLYSWYTVNTGKLCPTGWHVPSDEEWTAMTDYLGGESAAGGKLKEAGTDHWLGPNTGATNETGFSALPGGFGFGSVAEGEPGGNFLYGAYFWSSTSNDADARFEEDKQSTVAWRRELYNNTNGIERYIHGKQNGLSVRCVKDNQ